MIGQIVSGLDEIRREFSGFELREAADGKHRALCKSLLLQPHSANVDIGFA
jgi:hypothetical protein